MTTGKYLWSKVAATNASVDSSINWAEGMAPSAVNDSARAEMAREAEWRDDISGTITTGGTSTAYTLTSNQVFNSLANMNGAMVAFIPNVTSGGTATLNVDGLGAKALRTSPGVELQNGALILGTVYVATYVNADSAWYLQGAVAPAINWVAAGGTANAITATYSPAIAALYDGLTCFFRATAANSTTTPTFAPNGLTAHTITRNGGSAVRVGDIPAANAEIILRYNLANTRWELVNPLAKVGGVVIQTFTGSGTYTPTSGMLYCIVEVVGGGGAGGGAGNGGAGNITVGGGGGAGGYTRKALTSATVGASQTVTIGAGGVGANGGNGGAGGNTTFGALLTANGGAGGTESANQTTSVIQGGASGGSASGGDFNINGQTGYDGWGFVGTNGLCQGGAGGNSPFSGAGTPAMGGPVSALDGVGAVGFGSGGGGAFNNQNSTTKTGGAGSGGAVIVTEFVS